MAWICSITAAVAGTLMCAATAVQADPLSGASLPEKTKWVIHVDLDSGRRGEAFVAFARRLPSPMQDDLKPKLDMIEKVTGMKLSRDLHDVTLYGASFDETEVCLRVHGTMDKEKIATYLRADPQFRNEDYGEHGIMQWNDKANGHLIFVSFTKPDVAIVATNIKLLKESLDMLDGKTGAVGEDSPLVPAANSGTGAGVPQPIFWLAGNSLSELPRMEKAESPVLSQMDGGSLAISSTNDKLVIQAQVLAKTEKAAQQLQSITEGIKALVMMTAANEHVPPAQRQAAELMQSLTTEVSGKVVKSTWSPDLQAIEALISSVHGPEDFIQGGLPGNAH